MGFVCVCVCVRVLFHYVFGVCFSLKKETMKMFYCNEQGFF